MFELKVVANGTSLILGACNQVIEEYGRPCSCVGVDYNVGSSVKPKNIVIQGRCKQGLLDLIERTEVMLETWLKEAKAENNRMLAEQLEEVLGQVGSLEVVEKPDQVVKKPDLFL